MKKTLIFLMLLASFASAQTKIDFKQMKIYGGTGQGLMMWQGTVHDTLKSPGDSLIPITFSGNTQIGWIPFSSFGGGGGGSGTVTSITAGLGLTGGTITTSGTIALDTANASVLSRQRAANTYALIGATISGVALGGTLFTHIPGYGISGSNYTGAASQTWDVDSSIFVNKSGVQLLTNKFISGSTNTFSNIPNSALTNSSVTYNGIACSLGSSVTVGADVSLYMPSGRWFGTPNVNYSTTNTSFAKDVIRFIPIIIGKSGTIASIGINVNTGGSAGCTFRLGIYAGDATNGLPGTLLYDSGTLAGDVAADKTASPSLAVTPGLYWLACNNNATAGITFKSTTSSFGPVIVYGNSSLTAAPANIFTRNFTYAAMPNPAGGISTSTSAAQVPHIMIQF